MDDRRDFQGYTVAEYSRAFAQVLMHFFFAYPVRVFYNAYRVLPSNLYIIRRGMLLVSNHQSMADPFAVMGHIPFRMFLQIVPLYFPVSHVEYNRWYFKPFLKIFGGYDVGGTKKEKLIGLMKTRDLLKRKRTVLLFPEGKINKETIGDFHRGIEFFAKSSNGVVFVRMQGFGSYWDILVRKKPTMKFSEVHSFQTIPLQVQKIRALYDQF